MMCAFTNGFTLQGGIGTDGTFSFILCVVTGLAPTRNARHSDRTQGREAREVLGNHRGMVARVRRRYSANALSRTAGSSDLAWFSGYDALECWLVQRAIIRTRSSKEFHSSALKRGSRMSAAIRGLVFSCSSASLRNSWRGVA